MTWIEIEAPHLTRAYDDSYWPASLRPIRDQLPRKSGTPRFVIVWDGKGGVHRGAGAERAARPALHR